MAHIPSVFKDLSLRIYFPSVLKDTAFLLSGYLVVLPRFPTWPGGQLAAKHVVLEDKMRGNKFGAGRLQGQVLGDLKQHTKTICWCILQQLA